MVVPLCRLSFSSLVGVCAGAKVPPTHMLAKVRMDRVHGTVFVVFSLVEPAIERPARRAGGAGVGTGTGGSKPAPTTLSSARAISDSLPR
jgi:hypothetical protein